MMTVVVLSFQSLISASSAYPAKDQCRGKTKAGRLLPPPEQAQKFQIVYKMKILSTTITELLSATKKINEFITN